jgi:E3 ubiquitin-protein ligase RBBP6
MEKNKPNVEPPVAKPKIPEELLCNLCSDLLTDALLVPCCANSYCDECKSHLSSADFWFIRSFPSFQ